VEPRASFLAYCNIRLNPAEMIEVFQQLIRTGAVHTMTWSTEYHNTRYKHFLNVANKSVNN